mmetsp:Transcript_23403/g.73281  ORF Transcript_23403/g.73281 Transcript_23403/m.73281 type:complete len:234 (+) Transcript_23403:55-756(+)
MLVPRKPRPADGMAMQRSVVQLATVMQCQPVCHVAKPGAGGRLGAVPMGVATVLVGQVAELATSIGGDLGEQRPLHVSLEPTVPEEGATHLGEVVAEPCEVVGAAIDLDSEGGDDGAEERRGARRVFEGGEGDATGVDEGPLVGFGRHEILEAGEGGRTPKGARGDGPDPEVLHQQAVDAGHGGLVAPLGGGEEPRDAQLPQLGNTRVAGPHERARGACSTPGENQTNRARDT